MGRRPDFFPLIDASGRENGHVIDRVSNSSLMLSPVGAASRVAYDDRANQKSDADGRRHWAGAGPSLPDPDDRSIKGWRLISERR
jgi:hypothetical protein